MRARVCVWARERGGLQETAWVRKGCLGNRAPVPLRGGARHVYWYFPGKGGRESWWWFGMKSRTRERTLSERGSGRGRESEREKLAAPYSEKKAEQTAEVVAVRREGRREEKEKKQTSVCQCQAWPCTTLPAFHPTLRSRTLSRRMRTSEKSIKVNVPD